MLTNVPSYELWTDGLPRILNWEIIFEDSLPALKKSWYPPSFIYKLRDEDSNVRLNSVERSLLDFYQNTEDEIHYTNSFPINYNVNLFEADNINFSDTYSSIVNMVSQQVSNFVLSSIEQTYLDIKADSSFGISLSDSSIWRLRIYAEIDSTLGVSVFSDSNVDFNSLCYDTIVFGKDSLANMDMISHTDAGGINVGSDEEVSLHLFKSSSSGLTFSNYESVMYYLSVLTTSSLILSDIISGNITFDLLSDIIRIVFWNNQLLEQNFYDAISTSGLNLNTYVNLASQGFNSLQNNVLNLVNNQNTNQDSSNLYSSLFRLSSTTLSNIGFHSVVDIGTIGFATSVLQSMMFRQVMESIFKLDYITLSSMDMISLEIDNIGFNDYVVTNMEMLSNSDENIGLSNIDNVSVLMNKTSDIGKVQFSDSQTMRAYFTMKVTAGNVGLGEQKNTLLNINSVFSDDFSLSLSALAICDLISTQLTTFSLSNNQTWLNQIEKNVVIDLGFSSEELNNIRIMLVAKSSEIKFGNNQGFTIDINLESISDLNLKTLTFSNMLANCIYSDEIQFDELRFILGDDYVADVVLYREPIDKIIYSKEN